MENGHLNVFAARHRIELLDILTIPVHSAPYQAGFMTREFWKTEIEKILKQQLIDLDQTKWPAPNARAQVIRNAMV